jgi:hypothetical protein
MGMGVVRVCTLRQRASKLGQGDFANEDWDPALAGEYDPEDVYAEVSLYHHASRLCDIVVANYPAPVPGEDCPLEATDLAMHLTADMLGMDLEQPTYTHLVNRGDAALVLVVQELGLR